jgi:hypothetical protein
MTPNEFAQRLMNHYGSPEHAGDVKALVADYVAALNGADPAILQEASDRLLKAHTYRSWPTIGECRLMVEAVAAERTRNAERWARRNEPSTRTEPTEEQRQRVNELVKSTADRMADLEKRSKGKPVLDAIYEEIHGAPWPARAAIDAMRKWAP